MSEANEENNSVYKQMHRQSESDNRSHAMSTREAILKSDARVDPQLQNTSSHKNEQSRKFDEKSKLQGNVFTDPNASISQNYNTLAEYYTSVRGAADDYKQSIKFFEQELEELKQFSETKNEEITNMMPQEYEKFEMQVKNFFAKQQTQNFKMKKMAVKLSEEVGDLRATLLNAMDRVAEIEKSVLGDEQAYGMNNEEIERRSMAGSNYSPSAKASVQSRR